MPKDIRGIEIEVGDIIVYPGRGGSSLWMNKGVVTDIEIKMVPQYNYWGKPPLPDVEQVTLKLTREQYNYKDEFQGFRKTYTRKLERVAVVEKGAK